MSKFVHYTTEYPPCHGSQTLLHRATFGWKSFVWDASPTGDKILGVGSHTKNPGVGFELRLRDAIFKLLTRYGPCRGSRRGARRTARAYRHDANRNRSKNPSECVTVL